MVVPAHFGMWMKMQRYLCEINLNFLRIRLSAALAAVAEFQSSRWLQEPQGYPLPFRQLHSS
jgi:hypothetical protein